uniref:Uncharacterized protein n=1 Tax=Arundo donax TaxID=35708 RepID=A0A0A9B1H4_ARUDO
MSSTISAIN